MLRVLGRYAVAMVAVLTVVVSSAVVATASPQDPQHGIGFSKGCTSPRALGSTVTCSFTVANTSGVINEAHDTLTIDSITDVVATAGGPVISGNIIASLSLNPQGGATCTPAGPGTGNTLCTLPFGGFVTSNSFVLYGPITAADFALNPGTHRLSDVASLGWDDLCDGTAANGIPGGGNCNPNPDNNSAGGSTLVVDANIQITPASDTDPVGDNHTLTGHVNVSCQPSGVGSCGASGYQNAPAGTLITFSKVSGPGSFVGGVNTCTTILATGECTVQITSATAGQTVVKAATSVVFGNVTVNRATGDANAGDGPNATKTWVDAKITIAPDATNPVGASHTFTVTVQKNLGDGNGFVAAPGEDVDFTLTDSAGATHSVATGTCTNAGANTDASGQCTIIFTGNHTGVVTGHASVTVVINGASLSRSTSSGAPNGPDAVKTFVNANIQITPATDTDPVGDNHTLTGHVNVDTGDNNGFVNAPAGTLITFSIVSGPGSFVGAVNTCTTIAATGECTVQITSATPGTTVVNAATDVTVHTISLHRATGDANVGDSANAVKNWAGAAIVTHVRDAGNTDVTNTTVAAGTVVHDEATVTKGAGTPAGAPNPTGSVTFTLYNNGTCNGTVVASDPNKPLNASGVATSVTFTTPDTGGSFSYLAHYNGDAIYPGLDAACEPFSVVNANIQITPATANNPVGTNHVLTITVNAINGTIDAGSHTATASIVSGPGTFVGSPTCTYTGGAATASCTVTITSAVTGTTVVSATSNIPVGGVSITRTTNTAVNTAAGGSGNASKNWADDTVRTDIHDPAHTVITTAAVGTVVHDKVFVTKAAGTPAAVANPTGTVTFHRYTTNDCTGAATDETVTLPVDESGPFTVVAAMSYKASYSGDLNYPAHDGACEPLALTVAGKHLTYGGSMEGALKWSPGAFVNGGYHFKVSEKNAVPVTVQVTGVINVPVHCGSAHGPLAAGSPISVPVSIAPFTIPANSTAWYLSGDQNNILTWMGSVASPDLCGGQPMYNSEGATLDVNIDASAHTGQILIQWHYRIPAAKNKPNTDCTNDADPNRDRADVCGASWSATKDP